MEKALEKIDNLEDKKELVNRILSLNSKLIMLEKNNSKLEKMVEKTLFNINDLVYEIQNISKLKIIDIDELEKNINELNEKVLSEISATKKFKEENLKYKEFTNHFLNIQEEPDNLLLSIFNNEIAYMLEHPNNTAEEMDLSKRKKLIDLKTKMLVMIQNMHNSPEFRSKADKIIKLYGSTLSLLDRNDLSFEDFNYIIDLKYQNLENILSEMNKKEKELYEVINGINNLVSIDNAYRKELGMDMFDLNSYPINSDTAKVLNTDIANLKKNYQKKVKVKIISKKIKEKYSKFNYEHIPADKVITTKFTTMYKSYYLTPDKTHILIVNINEEGNINEMVVGVKTFGLSEDAKSIFEAQTNFCEHSKSVIKQLKKELNADNMNIDIVKPDINKVYVEDLEGVIPKEFLDRINNIKLEKSNSNKKQKRVGE